MAEDKQKQVAGEEEQNNDSWAMDVEDLKNNGCLINGD